MEIHRRTMGCHLPYGMASDTPKRDHTCHVPPRHKRTHPALTPASD